MGGVLSLTGGTGGKPVRFCEGMSAALKNFPSRLGPSMTTSFEVGDGGEPTKKWLALTGDCNFSSSPGDPMADLASSARKNLDEMSLLSSTMLFAAETRRCTVTTGVGNGLPTFARVGVLARGRGLIIPSP